MCNIGRIERAAEVVEGLRVAAGGQRCQATGELVDRQEVAESGWQEDRVGLNEGSLGGLLIAPNPGQQP